MKQIQEIDERGVSAANTRGRYLAIAAVKRNRTILQTTSHSNNYDGMVTLINGGRNFKA